MRILCVFGTRPEAIKFAPLIRALNEDKEHFDVKTCITAQHRSMLDQVLQFFGIVPDFDLDVMAENQSLFDVVARVMSGMDGVIDQARPDLVIVQGDTTTAFLGALAGYYKKVRVAHLEAGLRSGDKYAPWPEELNRVMVSDLSDFHFVPTEKALHNLHGEGITKNIFITGNTVIDALFLTLSLIEGQDARYAAMLPDVDFSKRIILITAHRRESFGKPFEDICGAIADIARAHGDIELIYPVHLNPNVREPVHKALSGISNIHLMDPVDYPQMIWLMSKAYLVLTDSGGIQEEAPALGKPVLVMREVTERQEGVDAGTARLVGTDRGEIVRQAELLLTDTDAYDAMSKAVNPYGDGTASRQIARILSGQMNKEYV